MSNVPRGASNKHNSWQDARVPTAIVALSQLHSARYAKRPLTTVSGWHTGP
jgi:hypothetical protein